MNLLQGLRCLIHNAWRGSVFEPSSSGIESFIVLIHRVHFLRDFIHQP